MPITLHANGKPLLKWSSLIFFAMILLDVWSANGDVGSGSPPTSKASYNLLNDDIYRCICAGNCVIHTDKQSKVRII